MARLLTLKWPKYGQVIDPTTSQHIYIYISLSLSFFLSLSLSLVVVFFLSSLLVLFLYFLFSFALFLNLSLFALFLCFCFMKRTTSKHSIRKYFLQSFPFLGVSCLALFFKSFSLSLSFPDFEFCFCLTSMFSCFLKKDKQKRNTNFWSRGGLQQNIFS